MGSQHLEPDDDMVSHCGSISGETFASRRRRNMCSLRQHSVDNLAKQLREFNFDPENQSQTGQVYKTSCVDDSKPRCNTIFHQLRFIIAIVGGASIGLMIFLRLNITVAMLTMVNHTALYMEEHPDATIDDFLAEGYVTGGEFDWSNEIQQMIMSWYMFAYTLPQMPATKLGIWIGQRYATPLFLSICCISTLLTPTVCYWGWRWVIALRLINAIGAAPIISMVINMIENWMPVTEISLGLTFTQITQAILQMLNPIVAGYLSSIHWSYAFYVPGLIGLAFCFLWLALVTEKPDDNWAISKKELEHICGCDQHDHSGPHQNESKAGSNEKSVVEREEPVKGTPMDLVKMPVYYAYILLWSIYCSSSTCFLFVLPTYLRQVLKISISENGFYLCMIQAGIICSVVWPHLVLKLLTNKFGLSVNAAYKTMYTIICVAVGSTWFYIGTFHNMQILVFFLNRCFHNSHDIVVVGTLMSNFSKLGMSGIAFSMVNTVGNLSIVFASTFIGWLLDYTGQSMECWSWIFWGLSSVQIVCFLTYVIFISSGSIQVKRKLPNKSNSDLEQAVAPAVAKPRQDLSSGMMNNFDKIKQTSGDKI